MFRIILTTTLLSFAMPALAAGPAAPTGQIKAPTPAPKRKFNISNVHDFLVRQCNLDGGGMISGSDGAYHCVDAAGKQIW